MGDRAERRRRPVRSGTVLFALSTFLLSLCLFLFDGVDAGVGASAAPTTTSTSALTSTTQAPPPTTTTTTSPPPTTTTTTSPPPTTTTTSPPPPITTTTTAPPPAPAPPPPPPAATALPARGAATAYGCSAALAYLSAYSAPGFTFECPGYALGHEAMTCINEAGVCANENLIAIADPCAAAYMNEASNSWVLTGASSAPIDPYGAC